MNKNIIAIDTSTKLCSVSIFYKNKIFTKYKFSNNKNNEYILNLINKLIKKNKIKIKNINFIAFNKGPGSITGIRISKCICKIFKFKFNKIKILKLSSFKIIAENYFKKTNKKNYIVSILKNSKKIYWNKFLHNKKIKYHKLKIQIYINKILSINKKTTIIVNNYETKIRFLYLMKKNKYINIETYYPKSIYIIYLIQKKLINI